MSAQRFIVALAFAALFCGLEAAEPAAEVEAMLKNPQGYTLSGIFDPSILPESALGDPTGQGLSGVSCNASLFTNCLHRYYAALGIATQPSTAQAFLALINNIIAGQGRIGYQRICSSNTFLYQCLGPVQTGACLNPLYYISNGDNAADAYTYASIRNTMRFQCGGGLMPLMYNFDCVGNTNRAMNATLQNCQSVFSGQLHNDYANACKYMQQFVNCYGNVFSKGCNGATGWAMCESVRVGVASSNLWNCPASCQVGHFSSAPYAKVAALAGGESERREGTVEEALAGPYAHVHQMLQAARQQQEKEN